MAKLSTLSFALFSLASTLINAVPADPANSLQTLVPHHEPLNLDTFPHHISHSINGPPPPPPSPTTPLVPLVPYALGSRAGLQTCDNVELIRSNILEGINYLISLGTKRCVVGQDSVVFVTRGDVAITGYSGLAGGTTSAPCNDVGLAVRWIVEYCASGPKAFGGTTSARGFKDVIVRVRKA